MNWNNIDLSDKYERENPILDEYSCDMLLLEVSCNLPEINHHTVREQAIKSLKSRYDEAVEILDDNLDNLVKEALRERADV